MCSLKKIFIISLLLFINNSLSFAACPDCCAKEGGVHYCDSSSGRFVCRSGYFSSCYCSRHAVMDLQHVNGCCLWQGGVMSVQEGLVICNNGGISEMCSLQAGQEKAAIW